MDHLQEHLLPPAEEQKRIDRPAEEKLREELDAQKGKHEEPPARPPSRRALIIASVGALVLLLIVFVIGYLPRHRQSKVAAQAAQKEEQNLPVVNVIKVKRAPAVSHLLLPGNITPLTEAYIYARASGYLKRRYVDIGDRVRAGQLLADIDAPDLDQQVQQARAALLQSEQQLGQFKAALEQMQAQLALARVTWERYRALVLRGAVARQDADQQEANYQTAVANVHAAEANIRAAEENIRANKANLDRLIALQDFEKVRAPFSGIITARNVDIGALISASGSGLGSSPTPNGGTQSSGNAGNAGSNGSTAGGSTGGQSGEMFRIAQIGTLRILVNVPQENAPTIRAGLPGEVFVQEFSKRKFNGRVSRIASSLDLFTRTMLTEVQVPNPDQALLPGMYAQVQFSSSRLDPPLLVPGDSLIARADGLQVAILEDEKQKDSQQKPQGKRIHLQHVEVGRDYGTETEVTSGLEGWEYVVVNPSDVVKEGAIVRAATASTGERKGDQQGGPSDKQPSGISTPGAPPPSKGSSKNK